MPSPSSAAPQAAEPGPDAGEPEPRRLVDGVFFTQPEPLPRGRHSLPREEVLDRHRTRLLIAATELLAHAGPAAVGVRAVCTRAGASLAAFYACFDTKEECIFAAYDRFIAVFLERLVAVDADCPWEEYVDRVMHAYFDVLGRDLVVARAFQVEMDSMGAPARRRRREALHGLAVLVREKHLAWDPSAAEHYPLRAYVAALLGVRQLASDALDDPTVSADDLDLLRQESAQWVRQAFATT